MAESSAAPLAAQIDTDVKAAMRAGDAARRDALRLLRSAIRNAEIKRHQDAITYTTGADEDGATVRTPVAGEAAPLTDKDIVGIIRTQIKQRRDSIAMFEKSPTPRPDLIAKEAGEIAVFEAYLPQGMDEAAMRAVVAAVIAETGASSPKEMGVVMPAVLARVGDAADRGVLSGIVRQMLSA